MVAEHPSLVQLLDSAFAVARSHVGVLLPVSLVYDGLLVAMFELIAPARDPLVEPIVWFCSMMVTGVLGFLASYATAGALWRLARGEAINASSALLIPWVERQWALPAALLFNAITVGGMIVFVIPGILAMTFLLVSASVAAVEHVGPLAVTRRAWMLGRGFRWRAAALFGLVLLALTMINAAFTALGVSGTHASLLLGAALTAPVALIGDVAGFLLYGDLRVRTESLDLELLAHHVERASG